MPTKKPKTKRLTPAQQHALFLKAAEEAQVDTAAFDSTFKHIDLRRKPPDEKKR